MIGGQVSRLMRKYTEDAKALAKAAPEEVKEKNKVIEECVKKLQSRGT